MVRGASARNACGQWDRSGASRGRPSRVGPGSAPALQGLAERLKIAIWVGGLVDSSTEPTGTKRTEYPARSATPWPGERKEVALEGGDSPWIEMLDHLDDRRGGP